MRRVSFVASIAVVVWAVLVVPMPYERTVPGSARPVEDLVTIGVEGSDVNGDLSLLTVRDRDATIVDLVDAALRSGQQLQPRQQQLAPGIDDRAERELLAQQFANSFTTAVAIAADSAGYPVDVVTEVAVGQVVPGTPADGVLRAGDVIRVIDGVDVRSASELIEVLGGIDDPRPVDLTIVRDGEERQVTVELELLELTGRPGLGIFLTTLTEPVELPFDVTLAESNIIGPSAGLMIAVTVADLLLDEDLADGRVIAGTGTIDGVGAVGSVGGIEQKVEAAIDARADLVLVPAEQAALAEQTADGRIEVVGVATLDEALAALRGDGIATDDPEEAAP